MVRGCEEKSLGPKDLHYERIYQIMNLSNCLAATVGTRNENNFVYRIKVRKSIVEIKFQFKKQKKQNETILKYQIFLFNFVDLF